MYLNTLLINPFLWSDHLVPVRPFWRYNELKW